MPTIIGRILRHWLPRLPALAALVAVFIYRLFHFPGWFSLVCGAALAVGILSNLLVISLNEGFMPIVARDADIPTSNRNLYKPINSETRLPFLADWIGLGRSMYGSPGDILIILSGVTYPLGLFLGLR